MKALDADYNKALSKGLPETKVIISDGHPRDTQRRDTATAKSHDL